jgi:hypothetical protein
MYEVKFSEDNWRTEYNGYITEESPYFYFVVSPKYGNRWISKQSCIIGNKIKSVYEE